MELRLTCLGEFQITLGGEPLTAIPTDKVRALLVYLAVEGQVHARSELVQLLWPGYTTESANNNLRQSLHRLRHLLHEDEQTPWLLTTRQSLQINPDAPIVIDVTTFTKLLAACRSHAHTQLTECPACLARLQQAVDLYQGDFLAGFTLADSDGFEEWRRITQEQLHLQTMDALAQLAEAAEAAGDDEGALQHARRQLALEPWLEAVHRRIMRSLARRGQSAAAIAQYNRCRQVLTEEMGVEPEAETVALLEQIQRGEIERKGRKTEDKKTEDSEQQASSVPLSSALLSSVPLSSVPLSSVPLSSPPLPVFLSPLVGRAQALAEIGAQLQQPGVRLLTLVGPGGMGKTRLAVEVGRAHQSAFADGVWFVPLASVSTAAALPGAIATALGITLQGNEPHQALLQSLSQQQLLLILDNYEQLLLEETAVDLVVDLLARAPGVQILVTSRQRLNLRGEQLYPVQTLTVPSTITLAEATSASAVRLFVQAAQRVQADFQLTATNLPAVLRICQLVQGMPLGLELAAANAASAPLRAIADALEQSAEILAVEWRDLPARQRSMRAVFAWSWQLLSAAEQRVLRQCALFRGGFDYTAAQAVIGATPTQLTALVNKSLLQWQATATGEGRYAIHELLRQFAAEALEGSGERAVVAERHGRYYLAYLAARGFRLGRSEPKEAGAEIQGELDNVRLAWHWAATQGGLAELDQALYAWWQFCLLQGLQLEARQSLAAALVGLRTQLTRQAEATALHLLGTRLLAKLLALHANYLFAQGHDEAMAAQAREAMQLGAASGGFEGEILGAFVLGRVLQDQAQRREAQALWEQALRLIQRYQPQYPENELLHEVQWMAHELLRGTSLHVGDYAGCRAHIVEALRICQTLGKRRGELSSLSCLAEINFFLYDFAAAEADYQAELTLGRGLGYRQSVMSAQEGLARIARLRGDYATARNLLEESLSTATELAFHYDEALFLAALIRLHCQMGDQAAATAGLARLTQLLAQVKLPKECQLYGSLAAAIKAHYIGDSDEALAAAEAANQINQQGGDILFRLVDTALILGHVRAAAGQWEGATAAFQEALAAFQQFGNSAVAAEAQAGLAQSALAQGDRAGALAQIEALLPALATEPHAGYNNPFFIYLTGYRVLAANRDPRAATLLQQGYDLLQQDAAALDEESRERFLTNVTTHRDLVEAYEAMQAMHDKVTSDSVTSTSSVTESPSHPVTQSPPHLVNQAPLLDWAEMPMVDFFVERTAEVAQLTAWLTPGAAGGVPAQLISILGMGGMGKTTLAAAVTKAVAPTFAVVIWRSLLNAPPLGEIVRNWLQILSRQTLTALPESLDEQLRLLLSYLQQERCLLVLDNVESIFAADESKSRAGVTRPGYEGYDQLFQRLASSDHQSCLLLTSREQPYALLRSGRQAQTTGRVQVLPLAGLDQTAGQVLLTSNGLNTSAAEAAQLVENYSGNPLALQIVAATIADFFGGDVAAFQQEEGQLFDGMRLVLDQQFARLSPLEREILVWLAIEREAITVPMLRSNFVQPQPGARTAPLLEALQALQNRSLLEKRDAGFALQNVIIEYTTEYLVEQVCREISEDKLTRLALTGWQGDKGTESSSHPVTQSFLNRFALLKADAKEYVRQSQMRLILQPLAERLLAQQSKKQVVVQINRLLAALRATVVRSGYAGGNLLNLLVHLGEDLTNVDFSHLAVWQADLRGVMFAALDFTNADLTHTAFTSAIDTGVVQFLPTGELLIADTSGGDLCLSRMIDGQLVDAFRQAGQSRRPLSFSADGATIVTAGTDYALHVWSTANGVCELTLPGHNGMIYALATSADGTLFASGGADRVVCLWDRQRGQLRQRLTGYEKGIDALAFTPDGRILATGGGDGLVRLWDTQSAVSDGSLLATLYGHTHAIGALAFSPDGRWLASGSHDGVICLWDRQQLGSDGTPTMQRWQGHSSIVRALLFQPASPTATAVAALGEVTAPLLLASGSSDQSIRLWSLAGELRYTLLGHTHEIRSLTFSADGRQLASSGTDQRVYWWDPQTGQAINSLQAYRYGVNCARFSPDGALVVSGSADRLVRLWPVASQVAAEADDSPICHSLRGHTRFVRAVAVSPSGRIVASGGPDRTVRLWDTTTRAERQILTGHTGHVLTLAFTRAAAAALLASAGADRTIRLWSIQEGQPLPVPSPRLLLGHEDEIHTLAFDRTGRTLASGCMDGSVRVWDVASGVTRLRLPGHTAPITMVAISPDGSTLASIAFDQTLRLWDLTTGECLQSKKDEHVGTRAVAFGNHPDVGGEFLAYDGDDFAIYVWPWRTGAPAFALRGHSGTIMTLDCSVTAPLLVSGGMDGTLGLWDLATRRCRQLLRAPGPYAGMKISGVTGISAAQKAALKALGAADEAEDDRVTNDKVTESPSHPVTLSPLKNPSKAVTQSPPHLVTPAPLLDWAEMPMVDFFVERTAEVAQLTAWLTPSAAGGVPAQLISILGMGGMGKTTLAAAVTKAVARTFAVVIWRSLLNAPPLGEIVRNWLQILSRQNLTALPESLDEQLRLLLNYLQQERCLLILDNVESIFAADESKSRAGVTRPGYEGYDQLFQRLASSDHQSCLLLTSREQPYALLRSGRQAQTAGRLQVLSLAGLDQTAGQVLLTSNGLNTSAAEAAQLVENYSGNPLALQIVAATITDFFGGDVAAFQQEEGNLFDGLRLVLDQQFARLSPLERDILVWLAIEREPVTVPMLRSNFVHPVTTAPLLEALQALQNRSLLEKRDSGLTLQNVIIEYTTEYLVTQVCEEILDFRFWILDSGPDESPVTIQNPKSKIQNLFLNRFALLKAQAKAYVRQSQSRFIVEPVVTRLRNRLGQADLTQQTRALITTLQQRPDPGERGYAAGNLLNLLIAAGVELTGYDLAGLTIWQAFLRTCTLYDVNFAGADLTGSEFADTFATITALTYSRDGRFLLGSASIGDIRVWLANTLQPVGMLQGHSRIVMGLAVGSAASQLLASCGEDGTVRLWDLATLDNPGLILYKTTGFVCTVAISPLADLVASAGDDPAIQVWDAGTRRQVAILRGHTHTVTAVAFSPDGRYLASCSGDHTVRLWDVSAIYQPAPVAPHLIDNSQIIYQWPPGAEDVWQITISPDGQWLAGVQRDGTLWRWQIDAALSNKPVQILQKQGVHHSTLRFSGDSSLLAVASQAKTIWLLDSHSGEVVQQLEGHTQLTNALAFSPDGKTLASSGSDRVLRVWELATGRAIQSVAGAARSFRDAVFAADGQTLVTCGADRTIRIWEITEAPAVATGTVTITGHCRHTLQGHSSGIWTVAVDTTSQVVASAGEDCNILLWERSTGRLLHKLQGHRYTVTALAFSPDGQTLVSGSPDQTVRLWNYRSYRPLVELRDDSQSTSVHEQSIWCVALSPDGATVAAGYSDGSIVLWDIRDPTHCRQIGKLRKHAGWVRKVAFSPDGTLLASGSNDQTVRIWDVVTGQLRAECKGHTDWVMSLTFHPDGQRLASAGYDNTIRLWDVATGKPVAPASVTTPVTDPTPMRHNKGVMAVTFHPQGHLLLSASQDERMIFWQVANQQKVQSLIAPGPYSGLNITGVTGLSEAQKAALRALGAVEE